MNKIGKVFLIGGGPGEPELITVKGRETLSACDAVVYDHLAPLELVVSLPKNIERLYAGKIAGKHSMAQDEINSLLVELARQGKNVARLKGGDPYVFGRGGEEALFLRENGVPFEIIPGVTAGIAGPGYAGIPVTHRGKSVYVVLLTGHEAEEKASHIPFKSLAKLRGGTIVGYMGVKNLRNIMDKLKRGGLSPDTPAAIIERGTMSGQKSCFGTIASISDIAEQEGIKPPALFVIGDTVELNTALSFLEKLPLAGKRVLVTRPVKQASNMYRKLRTAGADVLPLPSIETAEHFDRKGWEKFWDIKEGWLVFTSENGVECFFRQYFQADYDIRSLNRFKIAAVGTGTSKVLKQMNIAPDFTPNKFTVRNLAEDMTMRYELRNCEIVRVRGNLGDTTAESIFRMAGARVLPLQVYSTKTAEWDSGMKAAYEEAPVDIVCFTSGSTAKGLLEILGQDEFTRLLSEATVVSIGPETSKVIDELGGKVDKEASVFTEDGVVQAVMETGL